MDDQHGTVNAPGEDEGAMQPGPGDTVEQLRESLATKDAELVARMENEQELLQRLRERLIASDPEVDAELVQGNSIAELEESFAQAKAVAERLRDVILPQGAQRVPAGAPGRVRVEPRTAFEKIREGLGSGS